MRLKLVSPRYDTLLGHIDVPDSWQEWLKHGAVRTPQLPRPTAFRHLPERSHIAMDEIKTITLVKVHSSKYRDAVALVEGSIEEFEKLPGCSFTPSAAYLRSHFLD